MPETLFVEMQPARINLEPGDDATEATIRIENRGPVQQNISVTLEGLDDGWFDIDQPTVNIFPGDSSSIRVTIQVPRTANTRAGSYPFEVRTRSDQDGTVAVARGEVTVQGYGTVELSLRPLQLRARGEGTFYVELSNSGTASVRAQVSARDQDNSCAFMFPQGQEMVVPAASMVELPLVVSPYDKHLVGSDRTFRFTVTVQTEDPDGAPPPVEGELVQPAAAKSAEPLRKWLLWGGTALLVVVLGSAAIWIAGARLRQGLTVVDNGRCRVVGSVPVLGAGCDRPAATVTAVPTAGVPTAVAKAAVPAAPVVTPVTSSAPPPTVSSPAKPANPAVPGQPLLVKPRVVLRSLARGAPTRADGVLALDLQVIGDAGAYLEGAPYRQFPLVIQFNARGNRLGTQADSAPPPLRVLTDPDGGFRGQLRLPSRPGNYDLIVYADNTRLNGTYDGQKFEPNTTGQLPESAVIDQVDVLP